MRTSIVVVCLVLISASIAPALCAVRSIAVVGLKTYGPGDKDSLWAGVAVAEGVSARLAGPTTETGIQQVERLDVAEVLRQRQLPPVQEDCTDPADPTRFDEQKAAQMADVMRSGLRQLERGRPARGGADGPAGRTAPMGGSQAARLYAATYLIVGSVRLERAWGEGGAAEACVRVVEVATGVVLSGTGCTAAGEATLAGLQKIETDIADQLCAAIGGDMAGVDRRVREEKPEAYRLYAEACRLLYEGEFDKAREAASQAIKAASPELLAQLLRARNEAFRRSWETAQEQNDKAEVKRLLSEWGQATSQDEVALTLAAAAAAFYKAEELRVGEQRYREAAGKYRKAISLGKEDPEAYFGLAYCLGQIGDNAAAVDAYTWVVEARPTPAAYCSRANAYIELNQNDKAWEDCNDAIDLNDEYVGAYVARGRAYLGLGQYEKARMDFATALDMDPAAPRVRYWLGTALYSLEQYDDALAELTKAVEVDSTDAWAYHRRSDTLVELRQYWSALADLSASVKLDPEVEAKGYPAPEFWRDSPQGAADFIDGLKETWDGTGGRAEDGILAVSWQLAQRNDLAATCCRRAALRLRKETDRETADRALLDLARPQLQLMARRPYLGMPHFCLALYYAAVNRHEQAAAEFGSYLAEEPQGRFATDCREGLDRLNARRAGTGASAAGLWDEKRLGSVPEALVFAPVVSSDRRHMAWVQGDRGANEICVYRDGEPVGHWFPGTCEGQLALSGDGEHTAVVVQTGPAGGLRVAVDGMIGAECYSEVRDLCFSDDGRRLAYTATAEGRRWFALVDGVAGPEYDSVRQPIFSPDGKRVAYVAKDGYKHRVVVDGVAGPEYDFVSDPIFSPDGKRVAYVAKDGYKDRVVVDGVAGPEYGDVSGLIFSPDGKRVAYIANDRVVVDGVAGPEYDSVWIKQFIFSPDGKRVAYGAYDNHRFVVVIDGVAATGYDYYVSDPIFSPDNKRVAYPAGYGAPFDAGAREVMVVDGVAGPKYRSVSQPIFSPDGKRVAYCAGNNGRWVVVIDGVESAGYLVVGSVLFSPDSSRVAFSATRDGGAVVVLDGAEGPEYREVVGGAVSFVPDGSLEFLATRPDGLYRVRVAPKAATP